MTPEPDTSRRGRFIAFEGGEGCGKSTQAAVLADRRGALLTREPGGTVIGARIRELLLDPNTRGLHPRAEALLMAADRAQHVHEVVRPALESGRDVVTDRFAGSSIAYQGAGRGLDPGEVRDLSGWATGELWPDLTILLDVPLEVTAARLARELDRFEQEDLGFHERLLAGFRAQALADPGRWVVLDGTKSVAEVASLVAIAVDERLQRSP